MKPISELSSQEDQQTRLLRERAADARRLSGLLAGAVDPGGDIEREAERLRLFVNAPGGVQTPPYGSWWLEGRLNGNSTLAVAAVYREEGLQHEEGMGPADYLPAELEFLHFLLSHQHAARLTRSRELEGLSRARERQFLEGHLQPWLPAFSAAVRAATVDPFWLGWLDELEALLDVEAERLQSR